MKGHTHISKISGFWAVMLTLLLLSCSRDDLSLPDSGSDTGVAFFDITCAMDGQTKASLNVSNSVEWNVADELNYYTGTTGEASGELKKYVIPSNGAEAKKIPVEYKDGDRYVIFYTKGSGSQSVSASTMTSLSIANAVPSSQGGTFAGTHIGAAKVLLTSGSATLEPLQAFVKFTMKDLHFSDRTVSKIRLTGNDSENVCGDLAVTWTEDGTALTKNFTGTGISIVVDRSRTSFEKDTDIFIAIIPQAFTKGVTLTLYDAEDNVLATVRNEKNFTAQAGKIYNLEELHDHKMIHISGVEMYPTLAAFGKEQQKKIWIKTIPSDWNGTISWSTEYTGTETPSPISVEGSSTEFGCPYIEELPQRDTIDGDIYRVFRVTPTDGLIAEHDYRPAYLKAEFRDKGVAPTDPASRGAECKILVGRFIDMGLLAYGSTTEHCLWGRRNLWGGIPGNTGRMLTLNEDNWGGHFPWGCNNSMDNTGYGIVNDWTWDASGKFIPDNGTNGGKYNPTDGLTVLQLYPGQDGYAGHTYDQCDDTARWFDPDDPGGRDGTWRMPYPSDCLLLWSESKTTKEKDVVMTGTIKAYKLTSLVFGYQDMYVYWYGNGRSFTQTFVGFDNVLMTNSCFNGSSSGCMIHCSPDDEGRLVVSGNWRTNFVFPIRPVKYISPARD